MAWLSYFVKNAQQNRFALLINSMLRVADMLSLL